LNDRRKHKTSIGAALSESLGEKQCAHSVESYSAQIFGQGDAKKPPTRQFVPFLRGKTSSPIIVFDVTVEPRAGKLHD
jgi:hypothetical protein